MSMPSTPVALRVLSALAALAGTLACAPLRRGGLEPASASAGQESLESASRRWQGKRCRLALPLEVKRGAGTWTGTGSVYVQGTEGGRDEFYFQLLVEDRSALDAVFDGGVLRPDTAFVAEGWRLKDPESGKGPYLELRFADHATRARVEFRGVRQFGFDAFPLERLADVEEYCRQTLFAVSAEAAPAAAPAPAAPAPAAPAPAAPAPAVVDPTPSPAPVAPVPPPRVERASLQLVRVAANPAVVPRGGDAELVAVYSVAGLPAGGTVEVLERREVLKGGIVILSTEDRYERLEATFTSAKPLRFSFEAEPGPYLLRVTLEGGGSRVEASASFEIR